MTWGIFNKTNSVADTYKKMKETSVVETKEEEVNEDLTSTAKKVVKKVGDVAGATGVVAGAAVGGTAKTVGAARQTLPATKQAYNNGRVAAQKAIADDVEHPEETLDESTPTKKQVKQAFGIARDKRYAGGNMTGAVKAMDKINKGLAQHPAVEKELQKQNEESLLNDLDIQLNEVLSNDASAGEWIKDFVNSTNPKFADKSAEKRKEMALAAYYAAQHNESRDFDFYVEYADFINEGAKEIKHDNVEDKQDDQEVLEPRAEGEQEFVDVHTLSVTDEPAKAAGNDQTGTSKVGKASEPKGKGPASYDGKDKLGFKEEVIKLGTTETGEEGEVIDTSPEEPGREKAKGSKKADSETNKAKKQLSDIAKSCEQPALK